MACDESTTKKSSGLSRFGKQDTTAPSRVFATKDVLCQIFSFLDFYSLIKCQLVSKQWNGDAKDPSSVVRLILHACFDSSSGHIIDSIKRFRCSKHLICNLTFFLQQIQRSSCDKEKVRTTFFNLCSELILFNKLKKLELSFCKDTLDQAGPLISIIKKNNDKMVDLSVSGSDMIIEESDKIVELLVEPQYQNLQRLKLQLMNINQVKIDSSKTTLPRYENLKFLELYHIDIAISLSSWMILIAQDQFKSVLNNLHSLALVDISINMTTFDNFYNEIIPQCGKNLINLEQIKLSCDWIPLLYHISTSQHQYLDHDHKSSCLKEVSLDLSPGVEHFEQN